MAMYYIHYFKFVISLSDYQLLDFGWNKLQTFYYT